MALGTCLLVGGFIDVKLGIAKWGDQRWMVITFWSWTGVRFIVPMNAALTVFSRYWGHYSSLGFSSFDGRFVKNPIPHGRGILTCD